MECDKPWVTAHGTTIPHYTSLYVTHTPTMRPDGSLMFAGISAGRQRGGRSVRLLRPREPSGAYGVSVGRLLLLLFFFSFRIAPVWLVPSMQVVSHISDARPQRARPGRRSQKRQGALSASFRASAYPRASVVLPILHLVLPGLQAQTSVLDLGRQGQGGLEACSGTSA